MKTGRKTGPAGKKPGFSKRISTCVFEFCFVGIYSKEVLRIQEAQSTVQSKNSSSQVSMNDVRGTERKLSAKSRSLMTLTAAASVYE